MSGDGADREKGGISTAQAEIPETPFELSGGRLCLDFANTVYRRPTDSQKECLHSYSDLVRWGRQAGIVTDLEAQRLVREALHRPAQAAAVLAQAVTLREVIYRMFSAAVHQYPPQADDLATLNAALAQALPFLQIVPAAEGFTWEWLCSDEALDRMLGPVVRSAAELLTSSELEVVRECMAPDCGWLFMDRSHKRNRRWCDMKVCGNRAKARRHYERKKTGR